MIYCKLETIKERSAIYSYGAETDDMTGKLKMFVDGSPLEVLKAPDKEKVSDYELRKFENRHRKRIMSGKFPERLSYEF